MSFLYNKCSSKASKITKNAAKLGYILHSPAVLLLPSCRASIIKTGIKLKVPTGVTLKCSSSCHLLNKNVFVLDSLIDLNFNDEFKIIVYNFNDDDVLISHSEQLALIALVKVETPCWVHIPILSDFAE